MAEFKKVAIVHDWLVGGGAERVVLELHRMFPDAPIYTSYCSKEWRKKLSGKVVTGYLQHWPFGPLRKFLPVLRFRWFEHLNLRGYDLVISSSGNGEAKAIRVPDGTTHVCYCHSPTHFYWRHYPQYLAKPGFGLLDPLARLGLKSLVGPLRRRDLIASQRPHYMVANSTHIQADIKQFYGRDSAVIHPPVETGRFRTALARIDKDTNHAPRHGFITVGRQQPQKHTEIIVDACTRLNLPLTVIGRGSEHENLLKRAGRTITFLTMASDEDVEAHLCRAQAFIFAALDDFGIAPIEAMAAGTPVIAYQAGGALDYVQPGVTGAFFQEQTTDSLVAALQAFNPAAYDPQTVSQSAEQFSALNFRKRLEAFLASLPAQ